MKKTSCCKVFTITVLAIILPLYSPAATNTVTTLMDEDDGSLNPANGTGTSLREAINYSSSGDTIVFSISGTNDTIFLTNTLTITQSLIIDGTLSSPAPVAAAAWPGPPLTVSAAAGELRQVLIDATLSFHAIDIIPSNPSTVEILNTTVSRGAAFGFAPPDNAGAGINVSSNGTLRLRGVKMKNNTANGYGGGVYSEGELDVQDSTFENNHAYAGGAIAIAENKNLTIISSSMISNSAATGGAIANLGGTVEIQNSVLSDNSVSTFGGALYSFYGTLSIDNTVISGNEALEGGMMYTTGNDNYITDSTIAQNTADSASAVARLVDGYTSLENTTISGNLSIARILHADGSDLYLGNVTFIGNDVDSDPEILINNGAYAWVNNSVFDNNAAFSGSLSLEASYFGMDHGLSPLADFGGAAMVHMPFPGSPHIGSGYSSYLPMDQLGQTRPATNSTIGAVEYSDAFIPELWHLDYNGNGISFGELWATSPGFPTNPPTFDISVSPGNGDIVLTVTLNPEAVSNVIYRLSRTGSLLTPGWGEIAGYDGPADALYGNGAIISVGNTPQLQFTDPPDTAQHYRLSFEYVPPPPP